MKLMSEEEQRSALLEVFRQFDKICRKNNIKYSLAGGSLIGAIRHNGIIPWDDDIDIFMTTSEYEKILPILLKQKGRYRIYGDIESNKFCFLKFIDTNTYIEEPLLLRQDKNYGIFIDIFTLHHVPDDPKKRNTHIKKTKILVSLLSRKKLDLKNETLKQNILRMLKNTISIILGYRIINRLMKAHLEKYDKINTKYSSSNWPIYPIEKETHANCNFEEYIDVDFDGIKAMIFKNYDDILKQTYGDYMKLPPKSQRIKRHSIKAYWK